LNGYNTEQVDIRFIVVSR